MGVRTSSVAHAALNDAREVRATVAALDVTNAGRKIQHAPLWNASLDERRDCGGACQKGPRKA